MTEPDAIPDPMARWPDLPFAAWSETCDTLQLWTQIVGKVRIARTPLVNHWWNATFVVTARGLAGPAMPFQGATLTWFSISPSIASISKRATAVSSDVISSQ